MRQQQGLAGPHFDIRIHRCHSCCHLLCLHKRQAGITEAVRKAEEVRQAAARLQEAEERFAAERATSSRIQVPCETADRTPRLRMTIGYLVSLMHAASIARIQLEWCIEREAHYDAKAAAAIRLVEEQKEEVERVLAKSQHDLKLLGRKSDGFETASWHQRSPVSDHGRALLSLPFESSAHGLRLADP